MGIYNKQIVTADEQVVERLRNEVNKLWLKDNIQGKVIVVGLYGWQVIQSYSGPNELDQSEVLRPRFRGLLVRIDWRQQLPFKIINE